MLTPLGFSSTREHCNCNGDSWFGNTLLAPKAPPPRKKRWRSERPHTKWNFLEKSRTNSNPNTKMLSSSSSSVFFFFQWLWQSWIDKEILKAIWKYYIITQDSESVVMQKFGIFFFQCIDSLQLCSLICL
jgi:hypothetical protein